MTTGQLLLYVTLPFLHHNFGAILVGHIVISIYYEVNDLLSIVYISVRYKSFTITLDSFDCIPTLLNSNILWPPRLKVLEIPNRLNLISFWKESNRISVVFLKIVFVGFTNVNRPFSFFLFQTWQGADFVCFNSWNVKFLWQIARA